MEKPKSGLDPEWRQKLTACLNEIGLVSAPHLQLTVNIADRKVTDVARLERLR